MNIDVSIIIINYNTFQLTCNCIKSIILKSTDINFEIILIDNASTENDPELFKLAFPEIILLKNEKNVGFSKANNQGIALSSGEFVLLLNSDTVLLNNAIKIARNKLNNNNNIGAVSVKLISTNDHIQHCANVFPSIKNELLETFRMHWFFSNEKKERLFIGDFFKYEKDIQCDWIWGTFFMFPKSLLNQFEDKKLSDRFFMYYEDMEWCYQIKKIKFEIHFCCNGIVRHFGGASSKSTSQLSTKCIQQTNNLDILLEEMMGKHKKRIYYFTKSLKYLSFFYISSNFRASYNYFRLIFK